jgi:hypothetical protein
MSDSPLLSDLIDLHYRALQDTSKSSLDRLSALTSLKANLEGAAFPLVLHARRGGASWHEIGLRLGVSKQAAHKRFGFGSPEDG